MTASNDVVEAVARAICEADCKLSGATDTAAVWNCYKDDYLAYAKAAIQALISSEWPQESSPEMLTEAARIVRYSRSKSVVVGTAKAILQSILAHPQEQDHE